MQLDEAMLRRIVRRNPAKAETQEKYIAALVGGEAIFKRWNITTPERMTAFLPTILHESGELTVTRESMTYTSASRIKKVWPSRFSLSSAVRFVRRPKALANETYGGRMGNERNGTNDDDGWRYRGGGLIQLTGYDSYKAAGDAIGADLAGNPDLIEDPLISLHAACWEFSKWLKYADMGERGFRALQNAINRGNPASSLDPIGWSDRQWWYRRVRDAMGASFQTSDDLLRDGDHGPLVKAVQERLYALGYVMAGRADGVFGARTRAAVLAFQSENELTVDGVVGPETRAALNSETAKPFPQGDRAAEGAKELLAQGSTTLAKVEKGRAALKVAGMATVAGGIGDLSNALPWMQQQLAEFQVLKSILITTVDGAQWAAGYWYFWLPVAIFFGLRWLAQIEAERVRKHQAGIDLGH